MDEVNEVFLHTKQMNSSALTFYMKHGFEIRKHIEKFYSFNGVYYDSFEMVLHMKKVQYLPHFFSFFKLVSCLYFIRYLFNSSKLHEQKEKEKRKERKKKKKEKEEKEVR